jgi:hypothetical protein
MDTSDEVHTLSIAKKHQSEKAPLDGTGGNHAYDHGQSLAREGKFELSSIKSANE